MCSIRPCFNIKGICRHSILTFFFISYFIRYMYFMKMFVIKQNFTRYNIISKCPEHSLADLDMHTPLQHIKPKEIDTY